MRALQKGMKGEDVKYLQYIMITEYGQNIKADGSFGNITLKAVLAVQKQLGLKQDGSVGPATQRAIGLSDYIVHILDKKDVQFAGTPFNNKRTSAYPVYTLKQWASITGADKVYNLAFFNMTGSGTDAYGAIKGRTLTYLKADGVDCGYGGTADVLIVDAKNQCAGYKLAVKNGKKQSVFLTGARARNANGLLKDGRYFHIQSVTKQTENALVNYMLDNYQVDLMLIQDSGGSTGFYDAKLDCLIAGEREGQNGRPVASVVVVRNAKAQKPIISIEVCPCCGQIIKE